MTVEKDPNFEYYLKPPREQVFYKGMAIAMTFLRLANSTWWGLPPTLKLLKIHGDMFLIVAPICLTLQVVYLYVYFSELSFTTLGTMFSMIPATLVVNVKLIVSMRSAYKQIMYNLMDKIHIYNFLDDNDDFIKTKLLKVERNTRWLTTFLVGFILMDWLLWSVIPLRNNIINKERIGNRTIRLETCLYMWMPFDYGYEFRTWLITHAMNVYLVFTGGLVLSFCDSINFIFIFHFLCHVDILRHKMRTYFAVKLNDTDTKGKIVEIIKYHSFILSTFKEMEAGFGANVTLNYLQNLVNDSLLLYQIMVGDKANRFTYLCMMQFHMGGLILISFALEQIRIKTEDLALDLYQVPWEKMSTSNQKLLIPILLRMQTPLVFEGALGLQTGVRPLASIIKSTFSYYVMLKSSIE
uniref:Odorant receptor n=1 Tax=Planotortrix octo TaxID=65038 RepID=A0A0B5GR56_9NEOP|nr:olfactory receptor OR22 [Planotortrix octo]